MKYLYYFITFFVLIGHLSLSAGKWGDPIILGEWNKIPGLSDLDYDSVGNLYIQTSYCNWIRPKDKDTLYPITELKDDNKSYKYVVYQNSDGWKNIVNPRTEFGITGYVTRYKEEFLFVRNDSIYSINEIIQEDSIDTETFKYIGNDKWVFGRKRINSSSIEYFGFYLFDATTMSVTHYPRAEAGGTQYGGFITYYDEHFWYFCYPNFALSKFDKNGHELIYVSDSIKSQNPEFGYIQYEQVIGNEIWLTGEDKSVFSFNMDTYEVKQEVVFDESYFLYQFEKENIENSVLTKYYIYPSRQNVILHQLICKMPSTKVILKYSFYYTVNLDSLPQKVELKDTSEYVIDRLLSITNDGKMWFVVKYYPGGDRDQVYQEGVISFDPLAPDTEIIENVPTIVTLNPAPNPAKTYIKARFYLQPNTRDKTSFKIYNYIGSVVKELDNNMEYNPQIGIATKLIDVETLRTGVYYLVIDNGIVQRAIGFAVE